MKNYLTLKELVEGLNYPSIKVVVMNCVGETIKTFESDEFDDYYQYQNCIVRTMQSECVEVKQNHFGTSDLVISLASIIIVSIWGDRTKACITSNLQKGE